MQNLNKFFQIPITTTTNFSIENRTNWFALSKLTLNGKHAAAVSFNRIMKRIFVVLYPS